jgi:hypothetical protein
MDDGGGRQLHKETFLRFEFRWPDVSITHKGIAKKRNSNRAKTAEKQRI